MQVAVQVVVQVVGGATGGDVVGIYCRWSYILGVGCGVYMMQLLV